jgi:hypothetical protein
LKAVHVCRFKKRTGLKDANSFVDKDPGVKFNEKPASPKMSNREKSIRTQEQKLLNVWVQENFFIVAGISVVVTLIAFVFLMGAPPEDSRCTLPWC